VSVRNIFVVGFDAETTAFMDSLPKRQSYRFHELLPWSKVVCAQSYPIPDLVEEGRARLRAFPGRVDGIIGWWDFPTTCLLPILRADVGTPGPTLEAILACEHKGWSRSLQRQVFPGHIPRFQVIDPYDTGLTLDSLDLAPPVWMKPVKAHSSHLGFRIGTEAEFQTALTETRARIGVFASAFDQIMDYADLPDDVRAMTGHHCVIEEIIGGWQFTLEGYAYRGHTVVYGAVDSLREPNGSSFRAYRYPSTLPARIRQRTVDLARTWVSHVGFDNGPFNMEFFWDRDHDRISVLEINGRISRSHTLLFQMVDGVTHQQVAVRLSHGANPAMPRGHGKHAVAVKYMLREFKDAIVRRVPAADELRAIEAAFDHAHIEIKVEAGQRLSALPEQDSYSFETGIIFLGGRTFEDCENRYAEVRARLPLEFDYLDT